MFSKNLYSFYRQDYKIKKFSFTKKKIKILKKKYFWKFKSQFIFQKNLKSKNFKKILRINNAYLFLLTNRKFIRIIYSNINDSSFKRFTKLETKKVNKKFYFLSFYYTLERSASTILYRLKIISKIKYMRQLTLHNHLYVNGLISQGYSFIIKPLDFVGLDISFYTGKLFSKELQGIFDKKSLDIFKRRIISYKLYMKLFRSLYLYKIKKRFLFFNIKIVYIFISFTFLIFFSITTIINFFFFCYIFIKFLFFYFFFYKFDIDIIHYYFLFNKFSNYNYLDTQGLSIYKGVYYKNYIFLDFKLLFFIIFFLYLQIFLIINYMNRNSVLVSNQLKFNFFRFNLIYLLKYCYEGTFFILNKFFLFFNLYSIFSLIKFLNYSSFFFLSKIKISFILFSFKFFFFWYFSLILFFNFIFFFKKVFLFFNFILIFKNFFLPSKEINFFDCKLGSVLFKKKKKFLNVFKKSKLISFNLIYFYFVNYRNVINFKLYSAFKFKKELYNLHYKKKRIKTFYLLNYVKKYKLKKNFKNKKKINYIKKPFVFYSDKFSFFFFKFKFFFF